MLGKRFRRTTSMSHIGLAHIATTEPLEQGRDYVHPNPPQSLLPNVEAELDSECSDVDVDIDMEAESTELAASVPNMSAWDDDTLIGDVECEVEAHAEEFFYGNSTLRGRPPPKPINGWIPWLEEYPTGYPLMQFPAREWMPTSLQGGSNVNAELEQQIIPVDFLHICFSCRRRLRPEKDIFIGDAAFCSEECRHRQICNDERKSSITSNRNRLATASSSSSGTAVAA
ncbi:hypothetical protein KP509_20G060700 [Ceratopteris richardii]|uniref:FLZ-type domain-containing protein n=1 Tax=Ceratopteris richardii TaxID=49495 RepID=A0A8T2SHI1_CERRI|nr:hypothetical protein KP509_20G060700 [Ceratopteris richardii]